ncbi:endolytic transglycosylase MltG [Flavitalea flava]
MKRPVLIITTLLFFVLVFSAWRFLGPATTFSEDKYNLYIRTGMNYEQVLDLLDKDTVLKSPSFFKWLAARMDYPQNIKAGKYEIKKDMSLLTLVRMLRNGRQSPVHLVITKLRTRENLASLLGKRFESDSSDFFSFISNKDSLAPFGVDSNTVMTIVFPDTYTYFWNTPPSAIFRKMFTEYNAWWTPERRQQAQTKGLTPATAYILASIVEEETRAKSDKAKIASVYLNRMAKGMRLGADPTIKFALRNFELKRIYKKYLQVESPYNTYINSGLPPGPICTPSKQTLEAVLEAPKTEYLYFVAKPDLLGYSNFAVTYKEHLEFAKEYQKALDEQMAIRADTLKKADSLEKAK